MNKFLASLATAAAILATAPAQAVTFGGFSSMGSNAATLFEANSSQISVDFDIFTGAPITVDFTVDAGDAASYNFDSFLNIFAAPGVRFVTLSLTNGATFDLGSVVGAFSTASASLNGAGDMATISFSPVEFVGSELGSSIDTVGDFVINGNGIAPASSFQLIVSAGVVPEPATWAMMIIGFGVVGASLRRKRATVTFA